MDRAQQQTTGQSRRWTTGVTLVATAMLAVITTISAASTGREHVQTFPNASGAIGIVGNTDADNPFFQPLGTNGRSCATCHLPAQGWSITPGELRDRFERTLGLDPIFRANDGSNCEGATVSTLRQRQQAFSLLLSK